MSGPHFQSRQPLRTTSGLFGHLSRDPPPEVTSHKLPFHLLEKDSAKESKACNALNNLDPESEF